MPVRLVSHSVPFVSVIVRSYHRPDPLFELVSRLLDQDYPEYEVVIFEQSDDKNLLRKLESFDRTKLRVFTAPATNAPAARNAAIRHAVGDILLFIDDDDLPWATVGLAATSTITRTPSAWALSGDLCQIPIN